MVKILLIASLMLMVSGCHLAQLAKPVPVDPFSQIHDVPIFPGPKLLPLDYKTLSQGKITRYVIDNDENPNSPTQEAMLEACRELPIKNATARSASILIKSKLYGNVLVDALVVNNTTVLVEVAGVVRALRLGLSVGKSEILYGDSAKIILTPKSKWAVVGNKRIPLHMAYYWAHNGYRVMMFQDLQTVFHERDLQMQQQSDVQSMTVVYD